MDAILRQGSKGNAVIELQQILQIKGFYNGKIDGDFGTGTANAVLKFQKANALTADGVVGNASWTKLRTSNPLPSNPQPLSPKEGLPTLLPGSQGQAITQVQQLLKAKGYYQGRIDGDFGVATRDAIANFQRANGLTVDGKVGAQTWQKLQAPAIAVANPQTPVTATTEMVIAPHRQLHQSHLPQQLRLQQCPNSQSKFSFAVVTKPSPATTPRSVSPRLGKSYCR